MFGDMSRNFGNMSRMFGGVSRKFGSVIQAKPDLWQQIVNVSYSV
ncbi:hypothetical protein FACS1894200_12630 [Spirochaetia bacterium]|nr:hypothetical protein FACS1894200_12630 [Spirochaetia bacterium]